MTGNENVISITHFLTLKQKRNKDMTTRAVNIDKLNELLINRTLKHTLLNTDMHPEELKIG